MPQPPSTPRYKVNDKVKVINKTNSFTINGAKIHKKFTSCLLYTSDAADE